MKHRHFTQYLYLLYVIVLVEGYHDVWSAFNLTLDGHLHDAKPFSLPCFSQYEGEAIPSNPGLCSVVQKNYTNSRFRAEYYHGFQNNQDEVCLTNTTAQCLLDPTNTANQQAFVNKSCNQGSVSKYYVDVRSEKDVISTFKFAQENNVNLSIKNSGHDYLGRSSLEGSLALWTRNLGAVSRDPTFVPEGCPAHKVAPTDTITTGAGVNTEEVYYFADAQNVTFIGPYGTSIGVSGGWVQAGGHTVLSPVYGLGIDRVVQYKIVTPDGVFRTANICQNSDLFWALRGGGGGTFGVVIGSTHRVEKAMSLAVVSITFKQTSANVKKWFTIITNNSLPWAKQGWGGHIRPNSLISVTPLLSLNEAEASMEAASNFAKANNGSAVIEVVPSWLTFYTKYLVPNEAPVATPRFLASRLVPSSIFSSEEGRSDLLNFLQNALAQGLPPYIPTDTPFLYPYIPQSTSATPAWRGAVWSLSFGVDIGWNTTLEQRTATLKKQASVIKDLETLIEKYGAEVGSYFNEDSPWTDNWREKWWGLENYKKLEQIKKKYDPKELLGCFKCVGFQERSAKDEFGCYDIFT
ncbi:FAD-binding protein [Glarea lozoyensis ATCC 20868]|uniref:FAD-binding protein n=1 Tax=Glarea lozoyensis (strain ATCC 20868 / MF5171) TaxID=1116229 RepID=S3CHC8_GLAL2|nr:FAD-binding protein [Glarea lozoyensis ATCC 20868]EPE25867.1 FAD-binding protein [Glarea lozoyensis ATCC 20868]